jgi:CheY-like chemotaxis protein
MDGEIAVVSAPGEGSTFTITLEFAAATVIVSDGDVPRENVVQANLRTLDILVAEDDEINQAVIRGMLAGHRVTLAGNGEEAVRLAVSGSYDVILMDVMMPVMDGVVATGAIRALTAPASNVPIIALTANAVSGDRERYLAAGMTGYVSKPIEQNILLQAIEQVVGVFIPRPARAEWKSASAPEPPDIEELDDFIASIGT